MAEITLQFTLDDALRSHSARVGLTAAGLVSRAVTYACQPPRGLPRWLPQAPGVFRPLFSPPSQASEDEHRKHPVMPTIELDDATHLLVRFAARIFGVPESEVVARAVRRFTEESDDASPESDPWTPVDVYGEYDGRLVRGQYLPATRRLTVTTEPLAGRVFKSPSGAASAVVVALNPGRSGAPQTNGWRFWHLATTHERLEVLR